MKERKKRKKKNVKGTKYDGIKKRGKGRERTTINKTRKKHDKEKVHGKNKIWEQDRTHEKGGKRRRAIWVRARDGVTALPKALSALDFRFVCVIVCL